MVHVAMLEVNSSSLVQFPIQTEYAVGVGGLVRRGKVVCGSANAIVISSMSIWHAH
jgi:hypothetical protein